MGVQLIKRSSGWEPADAETIRDAYDKISLVIHQATPRFNVQVREVAAPTWAEHFGLFVRETFSLYSQVIEEMKDSSSWVVLQCHSVVHNRSQKPGAITLDSANAGKLDVHGYRFMPGVFNFVWEDNTLDRPWTPWGWEVPILSMDADDDHFFYDPATGRVIANLGERIAEVAFYGFERFLLPDLRFFSVS